MSLSVRATLLDRVGVRIFNAKIAVSGNAFERCKSQHSSGENTTILLAGKLFGRSYPPGELLYFRQNNGSSAHCVIQDVIE